MTSPAELRPGRALPNARVERLDRCAAGRYRELYRAVGDAWQWHDRDAWPDERLAEHLAQAGVSIHLFTIEGATAGYFELQQHDEGDVELVYFGLLPNFIGQGLGGAMLTAATEEAWRLGATSVWLHTCTLDHPNALANYKSRGFAPYRTEEYTVPPRDS